MSAPSLATVQARRIFYQNSTGALILSTGNAEPSIDTTKTPLRTPGEIGTFENISNYSRGLNGVIVDVSSLNAGATTKQVLESLRFAHWNGLDGGGFRPLPPAATASIELYPAQGLNGSNRIKIIFPNNAIQNTWLRVTLAANASTGLSVPDTFYFGHALAEVGEGNRFQRFFVGFADTQRIRLNQSGLPNSAAVTNRHDLDRDGRVNATDVAITRTNTVDESPLGYLRVPST